MSEHEHMDPHGVAKISFIATTISVFVCIGIVIVFIF